MAEIHIEEFFQDIARILLQLYRTFPRRTQVFVEDISGGDTPDEFGLHSPRHQSCFAAMVWLQEEGFIRFESTIRQEAIDQAVLTEKSFLLLSSTAVSTDAQQVSPEEPLTNIGIIQKGLKSATSTQLVIIVRSILFPTAPKLP